MKNETSLREQLKTQTMAAHDKIELNPVLSGLMAPHLTRETYVRILKRYLGFFRPLEKQMESLDALKAMIPDFNERRRTPALLADLQALGLSESELQDVPDCPSLPNLELVGSDAHDSAVDSETSLGADREAEKFRAARFLATNYVLEGSTLGGSMMSKQLAKHAFLPQASLNFLSGHREKTGVFWQRFIQVLEQADASAAHELDETAFVAWRKAATSAASETFTRMDDWMEGA